MQVSVCTRKSGGTDQAWLERQGTDLTATCRHRPSPLHGHELVEGRRRLLGSKPMLLGGGCQLPKQRGVYAFVEGAPQLQCPLQLGLHWAESRSVAMLGLEEMPATRSLHPGSGPPVQRKEGAQAAALAPPFDATMLRWHLTARHPVLLHSRVLVGPSTPSLQPACPPWLLHLVVEVAIWRECPRERLRFSSQQTGASCRQPPPALRQCTRMVLAYKNVNKARTEKSWKY